MDPPFGYENYQNVTYIHLKKNKIIIVSSC